MKHRTRPIIALFCLLLTVCPAIVSADEDAAALGADFLDAMMKADAETGEAESVGYIVSNLWLDQQPAEGALWRHFMHGVTDDKATVIPWDALLLESQAQDIWFSPDNLLDCELKTANLPTIRLRAGQSLTFRQPVLAPQALETLKGKSLRFFIWIKGEACGQNVSLWDGAPSATFILKDALGNQTAVFASPFKTRGTFPWHCYHMTLTIPGDLNTSESKSTASASAQGGEAITSLLASSLDDFSDDSLPEAPGLYLSLKNPVSGAAFFTALAWEVLPDDTNDYEPPKADPKTGSLAPNPDHDELPMHFLFGLADGQTWNFLCGNELNPNLTTIDGLRQYVRANKDDWFAFQHAIAGLASVYGTGEALKLLPPMEDGWLDALRELVLPLQDETTGLWLVNGKPSILATAIVVAQGFTAKTLPRQDLPASDTPWACRLGTKIPRAELLARSLLNARTGAAGQARTYWNRFAFHEDAAEDSSFLTDIDLGTTAAAIQLLQAIAATSDDASLQAEIAQATDQAVVFIMQNLLLDNGLWLSGNRTAHPDSAAFLPAILDASAWAESRPWPNAPAQTFDVALPLDGNLVFTWQAKNDDCAAVRLYAAPADAVPETIGDDCLLGIVNRKGARLSALDPLVILNVIENAMHARWHRDYFGAGAFYLTWKIGRLGGRPLVSFENERLIISKARLARIRRNEAYAKGVKFYGAAVSQTGRRSALVPLYEITN